MLRDLGPFLGAWCVLAPVSRIYRRPGWGTLVLNWALAVPVGVLVRQILLGRPLGRGTLVSLLAALVFTLLFLVLGRIATLAIVRRSRTGRMPQHEGAGGNHRRSAVSGDQRKAGRGKMPVEAEGLRDACPPHGRKTHRVSVREVMVAVLSQEGPGVSFEICVGVDQG